MVAVVIAYLENSVKMILFVESIRPYNLAESNLLTMGSVLTLCLFKGFSYVTS